MKKAKLMIVTVLGVILVGGLSTNAAVFGPYVKGPEAYAGKTTQSAVYSVKSSTYSSITGSRTHTKFDDLGWLRGEVCLPDSNRKLDIILFEDDVAADNADERVKSYQGVFTGNRLTTIKEPIVITSGNIDSAGDNGVELYLSMTLSYIYGDKSSTNGELFYFQFFVD